MSSPYERFGVTPYDGLEEVKRVYRIKAKQLHPDLRQDKEVATREFAAMEADYQFILSRIGKTPPPQPKKPEAPRPPPKPPGPDIDDILYADSVTPPGQKRALDDEMMGFSDLRMNRDLYNYHRDKWQRDRASFHNHRVEPKYQPPPPKPPNDKYSKDTASAIYRTKELSELPAPEGLSKTYFAAVEVSPQFAKSGGTAHLDLKGPGIALSCEAKVPPNSKDRSTIDVLGGSIQIMIRINTGLG